MLYFAADNESHNESKEIIHISRKTRWWGACRMRISSLSSLGFFFFFHFLPSVQPDGKAPAPQSSSYTHHIWWASCCRVSRRPCVYGNDTRDTKKLLFSKLDSRAGCKGAAVCVCVCICVSVCRVVGTYIRCMWSVLVCVCVLVTVLSILSEACCVF